MANVWPDIKFQIFKNFDTEKEFADIIVKEFNAFETNAHFYCFLAGLAYSKKVKPIDTKKTGQYGEVRQNIFLTTGLLGQVYSIALNHADDYSILKDEDKCFKVFEGYVNAGYKLLKEKSDGHTSAEEFIEELLAEVKNRAEKNKKFE